MHHMTAMDGHAVTPIIFVCPACTAPRAASQPLTGSCQQASDLHHEALTCLAARSIMVFSSVMFSG
jgi:hypothetical protein